MVKYILYCGNHDSDVRKEFYQCLTNVVEVTYATIIKYKKCHFYLSHYPTITSNDIDDSPYHKNLLNCYRTYTSKNKIL